MAFIFGDRKNIFPVFVLLILFSVLRFVHLGYSDMASDEFATCFYKGGKQDSHLSKTEYILSQRKGPLQLFVGAIPAWIYGPCENELAQRVPFALFSVFSLIIFYFALLKITKNRLVSFIATFLFGVNGLVSAYGRFAQYQNLNIFFSFASLYFFADLLDENKNHLKSAIFGSAMFGISFLAHWDAVYILIPIFYIFVKYLFGKGIGTKEKILVCVLSILPALVFILPFLVPYISRMTQLPQNVDYAENILGLSGNFIRERDVFQFKVYNPLFVGAFYILFGTLGIYFSKKNLVFVFWMLVITLIFGLFMKYSGLHFYNVFIPWAVLIAHSIVEIPRILPKKMRKIWWALGTIFLSFLYIQTYVLFVDHKTEYPVERERVLFFKTPHIENPGLMRHKTGFTHKRYWKEINEFINSQNIKNNENLSYYTNEYGAHVKYYMDVGSGQDRPFYAIGIKRPLSFADDYKFSQIGGKSTIHTIENEYGNTVVRIYRVHER